MSEQKTKPAKKRVMAGMHRHVRKFEARILYNSKCNPNVKKEILATKQDVHIWLQNSNAWKKVMQNKTYASVVKQGKPESLVRTKPGIQTKEKTAVKTVYKRKVAKDKTHTNKPFQCTNNRVDSVSGWKTVSLPNNDTDIVCQNKFEVLADMNDHVEMENKLSAFKFQLQCPSVGCKMQIS